MDLSYRKIYEMSKEEARKLIIETDLAVNNTGYCPPLVMWSANG